MAKLTKIGTNMSCFGFRGASNILLADGRTPLEDYSLREGMVVKDVINEVCQRLDPPIVPVVRPFFALCDFKTGHALCQTLRLTSSHTHRYYQLRVFINAGENSTCLRKYSRAAKNYYYTQLKTDFINGKLRKHMSNNRIALQMVAIDMVLEATDKQLTSYDEIISNCKLSQFMPSYIKEQNGWNQTLLHLFGEYYAMLSDKGREIITVHYIFAYEKDPMCGSYQFQPKVNLTNGGRVQNDFVDSRVHVSWKKGLFIQTVARQLKKETFKLSEIQALNADTDVGEVSVVIVKGAFGSVTKDQSQHVTRIFSFKTTGELLTFCSVIDAYYRLKVDANACVLQGSLRHVDDCMNELLGRNALELCHGPISEESSNEVFERREMEEGLYLVRESRSKDVTFILSLCQSNGILNYRISRDSDQRFALVDVTGLTPVPRSVYSCHTLNDLINHHHHFTDGLPILLKQNCPPLETGPIPLFPDPNDALSLTASIQPSRIRERAEHKATYPFIELYDVPKINYREELKVIKELGSGHFSGVHLAEWNNPTTNEIRKVAIKIPTFPQQTSKAQDVLAEMKREILTMYRLDHQFITKLLAVTYERHILDTIGCFPMIVMEFIDGGSLRSVLNDFMAPKKLPPPADWISKYLLYSQQIAEGMEYLGTKNVVHRDLATRNVLVVSDTHIKIADFGLARQFMENRDYYRSTKRTDLPVYWYAPECLMKLHFSSASDVWSFGVTIWEIFTLGHRPQEFLERFVTQAPNQGKHPLEALAMSFQGNFRLPQYPHSFPSSVYQILKKTWKFSPEDRPTFTELIESFREEHKKITSSNGQPPGPHNATS